MRCTYGLKHKIMPLGKYLFNNLFSRRQKHSWIQPEGHNTNIKIFNCISKNKVPFIVRNKDYVTWYTCGPTVYDSTHIGHASCYIKLDIIQRILKDHFKINLITVMNITDIDDKIIARSLIQSVPTSVVAKRYENEFWNDLHQLNISKPDIVIRVTEKMPVIISFIKKLINNNSAYVTPDGSVYFALNKLNNYGKLQNIGDKTSSTIKEKRSFGDFALWKATKDTKEPSWETEWGPGRPGWHIECSAMASAIFGERVDIHAGGIDLRFPHHENEEAQCCSYHGKEQWVNYWIHTGHLHLTRSQVKMSKSLGNVISVRDLLKTTNANAFRMACAMSHYSSNMEYDPTETIRTPESYVKRIKEFLNVCDAYVGGSMPAAEIDEVALFQCIKKARENIDTALRDDFNTAKVIKSILELVGVTNKMLNTPVSNSEVISNLSNCGVVIIVSRFIRKYINMLGFELEGGLLAEDNSKYVDNILNILVEFRQNVRNLALENKDNILLKFCDEVRNDLKEHNVNVKDHKKMSSWSK